MLARSSRQWRGIGPNRPICSETADPESRADAVATQAARTSRTRLWPQVAVFSLILTEVRFVHKVRGLFVD